MTKKLITAYVYDSDLRIEANSQGKNYWYEYIREMNEQLGLRARAISRKELENADVLSGISILFVCDLPASKVTGTMKSNLNDWVKNGGVLISFAAEGLDEIFGNTCPSTLAQPESDYTVSGYFSLNSDPLTTDIHSCLCPEQKLIIFSNIRCITPEDSVEIARLYGTDGTDTGYSAITKRDHNKGSAYYFAFNVPQTIWVLHQGIPITSDRDGDGYYRTGDLIAIGDNDREVLYADEILFLIQNMIAGKPQPLIYQIPPEDGQVPDAMFYWGGDDEAAKGTQVWASNWMKEKGLPYHINIMRNSNGDFTVTPEEARTIQSNGHECSLHYNFIDNFGTFAFTEDDVNEQMDAFYKTYEFYPVCTVNHWCRWTGWSDTARWMRDAGGKADNSFIHHRLPPMNPTNRLGFVFGTSYPFYFYEDHKGENAKIDFLEEPITAYEIGYSASDVTDFDIVHKVIDFAAKYHLIIDMFYHPVNVYHNPVLRAAIEEELKYIEDNGIIAVHKGNDSLWEWWDKRSRSQIMDVAVDENVMSFTACCEYNDGMIVKMPIKSAELAAPPMCDDQYAKYKIRKDFGCNWLFIIVPAGVHKITINL